MNIAEQIRQMRKLEERGGVERQRGSREYLLELMHLHSFFEHVRNLESNIVLDAGAGTTRAVYQLEKHSMTEGITLRASVLKRDPQINHYFRFRGEDNEIKSHITSLERLRGVPNLGGVIGVYSLLYSRAPECVVSSIDQKLVDGGVIKACFRENELDDKSIPIVYVQEYSDLLKAYGYGVAVKFNQFKDSGKVLLALKNRPDWQAEELLQQDEDLFLEQLREKERLEQGIPYW